MVIVKNQPQPAEYNDIRISLETNTGEQFIIGLPGNREDRDFLAFNKAVENIDHRNVGLNHLPRHHSHHRVNRRTADFDFEIGR